MTILQIASKVEKFAIDNSPLLLTGVAVAGVVTTAVLTAKASYRAAEIIREYENVEGYIKPEYRDVSIKKKVRLVWPLFIPPLGVAAVTVTSIICANRIGTRRAAAMAAAFTVSEKAFEEYRDKVVDRMGTNKEREVRDSVAQDHVRENPLSKGEVILLSGDSLFLDTYSGRYFKSDMESVKKSQNDLNYKILNHQYASLNDFYNLLGLDNVRMGEEVGWNSDKQMEIEFGTTISDDQKPCITITFYVSPVRNYFRAH